MDIESTIKNLLSEILTSETLNFSDEINLEEYLDSIQFVQLIIRIEDEFNIEYPPEKLLISESNTISKIVSAVKAEMLKIET